MNQNRGKMTTGVVLVVVGLLALLGQFGLGTFFGEALVAGVGVVFLLLHFVGKVEWAIYPGAFTATVGTVIFLATRNLNMDVFWPLFVIAPGVSFLIIRASSPNNHWAIFPGLLITGIGLVMFLFSSGIISWLYLDIVGKLWPVALIVMGLFLIYRTWKPGRTDDK